MNYRHHDGKNSNYLILYDSAVPLQESLAF